MVIRGQAGLFEPLRLIGVEHAERDARLHAERASRRAPSTARCRRRARPSPRARPRPCKSASRPTSLAALRRVRGPRRPRSDFSAATRRVVVRALRTIGAVLGAAARLDGEQRAQLHLVGGVMLAMDALRAKEQLRQRQIVDGANLGQRRHGIDSSIAGIGSIYDAAHAYRRRRNIAYVQDAFGPLGDVITLRSSEIDCATACATRTSC